MNDPRHDPAWSQMPVAVEVPSKEVELFALFKTLWLGKWWILLCASLAIGTGGYYGFRAATPVYTATSVLALEERKEQVADLDSVMSGLSSDTSTLNTEIVVMRSRELLGKLVIGLDLTKDPEFNPSLRAEPDISVERLLAKVLPTAAPPVLTDEMIHDGAVDLLLKKVDVSNLRHSYVFEINVTTTDAEKSARIANTLAELYIQDQLEVKFRATEKATSWLTERTSQLQNELEQAENRVKQFLSETDLVSTEALFALNRQLKEMRQRVEDTRDQVGAHAVFAASYAQVTGEMSAQEISAVFSDPSIQDAAKLVGQGGLSEQAFRRQLDRQARRHEVDAVRQNKQLAALEATKAELEAKIAAQSEDFVTLQQMEREATASRLIYEHFLSRLKETSVQQGIQQADARLLSRATVPFLPSAPRKAVLLVLSAIVGLFVGAALVVLREVMQKGLRTVDDLETMTGLTVMGQIPTAPTRRRRKLLDYIAGKSNSAFSEAVRNLRTTMLMSRIDNPPRIIMLTSSVPAEGKTTQSLALSHNLAVMGKRVLLIEADIRRRTFGDYFSVSTKSGLLSAVMGDKPASEIVYHDEKLGFDILFGEKSKVNAADFFASEQFGTFLERLSEDYDFVLLDTPPVLAVPDARVIAQHVDALLYVVRWDSTAKSQVRAGLRALETARLHVDGLVMSQVSEKGMKRYGYESGYGYGRGYYDA